MSSTRKTQETAGGRSWRVRMDGGEIYAASNLEELQQWARDGRIAPTTSLSIDDGPWSPANEFEALAMDWVAEVSPGVLYGPVHHSAIDALKVDGSLPVDARLFKRHVGEDPRKTAREAEREEHERSLAKRIDDLEKALADAEQSLRSARVESESAKGSVAARDMEADAERQEHQAAVARLNAEVLKRDARIAALERKSAELEQALAKSIADSSASASFEQRAIEAEQSCAALEKALAMARDEASSSAASLASARTEVLRFRKQGEDAKAALRAAKLREESFRKHLQQALSAIDDVSGSERISSREAVEVIVDADGVATPSMSTIDALESQARQELNRFGANGHGRVSKGDN